MNRRFEGGRVHYNAWGNRDMLPKADGKLTAPNMDESEAVTRIMHVLNTFGAWDLKTFSWTDSFDSQGVDSLEQIAILTSIEHEFHIVFEDNVFDSFENLQDVLGHLVGDHHAF